MEVKLENVSCNIDDDFILENINVKFLKNKIHGIIGQTGSGKTLLLNTIAGVNSYKGDISFDSQKINYKYNSFRKMIGLVSQSPIDDFCQKTVYDELNFVLDCFGIKDESKINQVIKIVGLPENILTFSPFKLTTGQISLLSIALTLIYNPPIILLDEPLTKLDDEYRNYFFKLIKKLKNKYNKTILIASNDIDFINQISDCIHVIHNKKLYISGLKNKIFKDENYKTTQLPKPFTIRISDLIEGKYNKKIGYRDNINDLIKDIYRNVK